MEHALFCLHKQLILQEAIKAMMNMSHMGDFTRGEDKNIVQVNIDKLIEHVSEHIVNKSLNNSGGVIEVKKVQGPYSGCEGY